MILVHDNIKIIILFDAPDLNISTNQTVFEGTIAECNAEIERLGLTRTDDQDPYCVERIFKAPSELVENNQIPIMPDDDVLPIDVLQGIMVKDQDGYTYMRCQLSEESLLSMLENSTSGELDIQTVLDLGITGAYAGVSENEIL